MSIRKVKTFTNLGLEGYEVIIEADMNNSLPTIEIIWLPDAAIKESKERIRATFRNANITLPDKKIILNLAPSDTKKVGTRFDFPMAVAIILLMHWDMSETKFLEDSLFFGELGLDGKIKWVPGLLPAVVSALKKWYKKFFVPIENIYELEYIPNISIYPIRTFKEFIDFFLYNKELKHIKNQKSYESLQNKDDFDVDFAHIKWHLLAKRACMIAASGQHNLLFIGAPGSGKTMLSKALKSILPPLNYQEILQVSQIYSLVWKLNKDNPLITQRPFRQVHHTASPVSIIGWWRNLTPGEVSLAHKGILFFDELSEFPREVLEVLRQPLEDQTITISRAVGSVEYPASVMFVASMNPCKCWFYQDPEKSCLCSHSNIKKYQSKLSGPLLDRIDMILEIPRENIEKILDTNEKETSTQMREKVLNARKIQEERYKNSKIYANGALQAKHLKEFIPLDKKCKEFLQDASQRLQLSPRVVHRIMKLGRTIADLDWSKKMNINHLSEAFQYRNKNMLMDE